MQIIVLMALYSQEDRWPDDHHHHKHLVIGMMAGTTWP
jgi:hypothetical protein